MLKSFLSRLFAKPIARNAKVQDLESLRRAIQRSSIIVVGSDIGAGVDPSNRSDDLPKITEFAAQRKSFDGAHKFELDGKRFLPIFLDTTSAKNFCGSYVDLLSEIHAFRLFRISGAALASCIDDDVLVFNSQNNDEIEFSCEQSLELKEWLAMDGQSETDFLSIALPVPGVDQEITFTPNKN
ncbi:hypothetical protein [Novipirellula caenicola]|uniref:Uncharacterized protein n=1 Tax=Novipirellula caenicola TaxID=1536901 RepID=A0ABP9VVD2_9BACT